MHHKILGFIVGFVVALGFEVGLLMIFNSIFDKNMSPRGLGWIMFPVMAGVGLSSIAPILAAKLSTSSWSFRHNSTGARFVVFLSGLWLLSASAYVFLFEPYGSSMYSEDYSHMFKVMLFPLGIIVIGYFTYSKFVIGNSTTETSESNPAIPDSSESLNVISPADIHASTNDKIQSKMDVIRNGNPSVQTYMDVATMLGGSLTPVGFIFDMHYVIVLDGKQSRVDDFQDLRQWFIDNVVP